MQGNPPAASGLHKGVTLRTEEQVRQHWKVFGWDEQSGEPLPATVEQLGIPALLRPKET